LSSFEYDNGSYYYTDLVECALATSSPTQRALLDSNFPTLTANLGKYIRGSDVNIVDGSRYELPFDNSFQFNTNDYQYSPITTNPTVYDVTSLEPLDYPNYALSGSILVKNSYTQQVLPILEMLPYLESKYSNDIIQQISSNVISFDMSNDIIFIETPNYLTINKISVSDGVFEDPKTNPTYKTHSNTEFDKISNRIKRGNDIFYYKLNTTQNAISSNNFLLYPEIYRFDSINFINNKIFPLHESDLTDFFNISGGDVRYVKSETPKISYSSRNNTFNISFLLKDQNDMVRVYSYSFYLNPDVIFAENKILNSGVSNYSNTFDTNVLTVTPFLSGSAITINTQTQELII
jgi:hypothetical protein